MMGRIFRGLGYSLYFLIALLVCVYFAIPTEKVKGFAEHHASRALKTKVSIGKFALRGLGGVTLEDVQVIIPIASEPPPGAQAGRPAGPGDAPLPGRPPPPGKPGETKPAEPEPKGSSEGPPVIKEPPGVINAASVKLDVNLLGLLMGKPLRAALNAEVSGGEINGLKFERTKEGFDVEVREISSVNLAPTRLLKLLLKTDLQAMLSGFLSLSWKGSMAESKGQVDLTLSDSILPSLTFKDPSSGFPLAEAFNVQVGQVELKAALDKRGNHAGLGASPGTGAATLLIEKLSAKGEHLELQLDTAQKHTVTFNGPKAGEATVDVKLVLFFTDAFYAWKGEGMREDGSLVKDASHAGLKEALEGPLSPVRAARVRFGKGFYYGYHCSGMLKSLKCVPQPPSRRFAPGAGGATDGNQVNAQERPKVPAEAMARPTVPPASPAIVPSAVPPAPPRPAAGVPTPAVAMPPTPVVAPVAGQPVVAPPRVTGSTIGAPRIVEPGRPQGAAVPAPPPLVERAPTVVPTPEHPLPGSAPPVGDRDSDDPVVVPEGDGHAPAESEGGDTGGADPNVPAAE